MNTNTITPTRFDREFCKSRVPQFVAEESFLCSSEESANNAINTEIGNAVADISEMAANLFAADPLHFLEELSVYKRDRIRKFNFEFRRIMAVYTIESAIAEADLSNPIMEKDASGLQLLLEEDPCINKMHRLLGYSESYVKLTFRQLKALSKKFVKHIDDHLEIPAPVIIEDEMIVFPGFQGYVSLEDGAQDAHKMAC